MWFVMDYGKFTKVFVQSHEDSTLHVGQLQYLFISRVRFPVPCPYHVMPGQCQSLPVPLPTRRCPGGPS